MLPLLLASRHVVQDVLCIAQEGGLDGFVSHRVVLALASGLRERARQVRTTLWRCSFVDPRHRATALGTASEP